MLLALHFVDYGVLLLFCSAMLVIGFYFRNTHRRNSDYFLASRSIRWPFVGLSLAAILFSGVTYVELPGDAYWAGLKLLPLPIMMWVALAVIVWFVLPIYHGLEISSAYEYLQIRFDAPTRIACAAIFVASRLWLCAALYIPCNLLVAVVGVPLPTWLLVFLVGMVTTVYSSLGGMRGSLESQWIQFLMMAAGLIAVVFCSWWILNGGPNRVWEISEALDRSAFVDLGFNWKSSTSIWSLAPFHFIALLAFLTIDQVSVQRVLSPRSFADSKRALILAGVAVSMVTPLLVYVGLCLLGVYYDHPEKLRTKWVVNVAGETQKSLSYADRDRLTGGSSAELSNPRPLLEWDNPDDDVSPESVERLIREQRLIHPNRKVPFKDSEALVDRSMPSGLDLEQFATHYPPKGSLRRGEIALNLNARRELMPWFLGRELPLGIAGLAVAGVLAATMVAMNAGILGIGATLTLDLRRVFQQEGVTDESGPAGGAHDAHELKFARLATFVCGLLVTVLSIGAGGSSLLHWVAHAAFASSGPVLGVFVLGLFTRQCTGPGVRIALLTGFLTTIWLTLSAARLVTHWPFEQPLHTHWPMILGTLITMIVGYTTSLFVGKRKSKSELRGIVVGCGRLGMRTR